ncbi:MAG: hypothetical protein ABWY02_03825 [Telluria sp.]
MSSIQSASPSTASTLWNNALAFVQNVAGRLVVPVASTEEMNDVWKLYRLTRGADSVRPAVLRELASGEGR